MKIGLVLAGGGGKGAYELGVWRALKELNISEHISVFSGASIGGVNAMLFAMDDIEKAEQMWEEVSMDKLVPVGKLELLKRGIGLYIGGKNPQLAKKFLNDNREKGAIENKGAIEIIDKYLDFNKIKEKNKICYVSCTRLSTLTIKYFRLNDYDEDLGKKMILASASLPLIYESIDVLGERYIDGGVVDNIPIQPVYGENCDIIIVVALNKEVEIDRSLYPNSKLIIISPENLSENTINGTLNLDTAAKRLRIIEGYNDTINKLKPIMELSNFIIKKSEEEKNSTLYLYKMLEFLKKFKVKPKSLIQDNIILKSNGTDNLTSIKEKIKE